MTRRGRASPQSALEVTDVFAGVTNANTGSGRSRAYSPVAAIVETCFADDREPLRRQLIAAIAAKPDRGYWDSWTVALEQLLLAADLIHKLQTRSRRGEQAHAVSQSSAAKSSDAAHRPVRPRGAGSR